MALMRCDAMKPLMAGAAKAARIAIMDIETNSSIRVNPHIALTGTTQRVLDTDALIGSITSSQMDS